jgi:predicted RNase H-like nuclease (RuvC/YqgF family)
MSVESAIDKLNPASTRTVNARSASGPSVHSAPTQNKRMGRPPMTEEQKEAARREREAAKLANSGQTSGQIKKQLKEKTGFTGKTNGNGIDSFLKRLDTELANAEKSLAQGQKKFELEERQLTKQIETLNAQLTKLDENWGREKNQYEGLIKRLQAALA